MIDIIIPAYNCSSTLVRTLSSMVTQVDKDFEVTIVDDCSTDNILEIAEYFSNYLNINYVHCDTHLGKPGMVRNVGIENTKNEIIMFCDADDFLSPDAVKCINKLFSENDIDFVIGSFYEQLLNNEFILKNQNATTWLHGNAYKREFLDKYNIRFPEQKLNEDGAFNTQVYLLSNKFKLLSTPIYYWMYSPKSLTRKSAESVDKSFKFESLIDLVNSLQAAYINLFKFNGYDDKTLLNMGKHLATFHAKFSSLVSIYATNSKKYKKLNQEVMLSLQDFMKPFDLDSIVNSFAFKQGFCSSYLQYKKPTSIVDLPSFFKLCGINMTIKIEDFCNLLK